MGRIAQSFLAVRRHGGVWKVPSGQCAGRVVLLRGQDLEKPRPCRHDHASVPAPRGAVAPRSGSWLSSPSLSDPRSASEHGGPGRQRPPRSFWVADRRWPHPAAHAVPPLPRGAGRHRRRGAPMAHGPSAARRWRAGPRRPGRRACRDTAAGRPGATPWGRAAGAAPGRRVAVAVVQPQPHSLWHGQSRGRGHRRQGHHRRPRGRAAQDGLHRDDVARTADAADTAAGLRRDAGGGRRPDRRSAARPDRCVDGQAAGPAAVPDRRPPARRGSRVVEIGLSRLPIEQRRRVLVDAAPASWGSATAWR